MLCGHFSRGLEFALVIVAVASAISALPGASWGEPAANGPTAGASATRPISIEVGLLGIGVREGELRPQAKEWFLGEIDSFMQSHPDIDVKTFEIDDQRGRRPLEEYQTLPANVIGISSEPGYETAFLVKREEIVPLEQFLPDPEFKTSDFPDTIWEPVKFQGKIWGVPWATTTPALACNWPMFEEAGITTPPQTWEELIEDAKRLTKDTNGDGAIDQTGFVRMGIDSWRYVTMAITLQKGASLITSNGFAPYSPDIEAALTLAYKVRKSMDELVPSGLRPPTFAMAFTYTRRASLSRIPANMVPAIRLTYLPTCGKNLVPNIDSFYLAARRSTPEKEAASWKFIKWISRKDVALPTAVGGYPARLDLVERDDFKLMAAKQVKGFDMLWRSNERLSEFGPYAIIGRYKGIVALMESVKDGELTGEAAKDAWNATAKKLNEQGAVLKMGNSKSYELFK